MDQVEKMNMGSPNPIAPPITSPSFSPNQKNCI